MGLDRKYIDNQEVFPSEEIRRHSSSFMAELRDKIDITVEELEESLGAVRPHIFWKDNFYFKAFENHQRQRQKSIPSLA